MSIAHETSAATADEMADLEEVCRLISVGKRVADLALLERIYARSDRVRHDMFEKHGITDIAVDLIREVRDEE